MRRRRRRGARTSARARLILLGAGGAALIAVFVLLINMGDRVAPERQETRVELKGAFKD